LAASENWPDTVVKLESMAVSYASDQARTIDDIITDRCTAGKKSCDCHRRHFKTLLTMEQYFEKRRSESCPLQAEQSTKAKTRIFHI
jgi:hypothetical protein